MRVLVGDQHPISRAGLRSIVERRGCHVVGEAPESAALLHLARTTAPQLVLLSVHLPGLNAETWPLLAREFPHMKYVLLAQQTESPEIAQAAQAIRAVSLPWTATCEEIEQALAGLCGDGPGHTPEGNGHRDGTGEKRNVLSARQSEVLRLLAEGQSTKEVASLLGLSPKTVDAHRAQIMRKLQVNSVPALVRYALRVGLIDQGP